MSPHDPFDDQPFDEESLRRALRAPGSAAELGREEEYAAMFRAASASGPSAPVPLAPRRRRTVSRFGAGSAFVVVLAVGGSAAAAYTNHLPEPIQDFAHRALGPVGPPAHGEKKHHAREREATPPPASASSAPSEAASPSSSPTTTPTRGPSRTPSPTPSPTTAPTPVEPTPTVAPPLDPTPSAAPTSSTEPTPSPSPTSTPSPSPTSTPTLSPPVVAAAVSISGSTHKVEVGQSVAFAGVVTSYDGTAVRRAKVALQVLAGRWTTVSTARSDASGAVSLVLPPVSASTAVRLRTGNGTHSSRWRVTLHPSLSVTSAPGSEPGTVVISVTAAGARPGDAVQLLTEAGLVGSGTLSGDSVTFTVAPSLKRTRYVVLLPGTVAHSAAKASITVVRDQGPGRPNRPRGQG